MNKYSLVWLVFEFCNEFGHLSELIRAEEPEFLQPDGIV